MSINAPGPTMQAQEGTVFELQIVFANSLSDAQWDQLIAVAEAEGCYVGGGDGEAVVSGESLAALYRAVRQIEAQFAVKEVRDAERPGSAEEAALG